MARTRIGFTFLVFACTAGLLAQRTIQDKNNQTLVAPRDPPLVAAGQTSRLMFHVSPLSGQGLFSQQTRDALKAILKLNGGAQIVHIRAFSAGSGDVRRIPQIVSDVLADKHGSLPSISVLQVGALTMGDAQIVLEAVSEAKKDVNRDGLTFHSAEIAAASDPSSPVRALLQKAAEQLAAKINGKPALSVTCFVSALEGAGMTATLTARFPGAATNLVQLRRLPLDAEAACEGVSRGGGVAMPRVAFSGTQVSFATEEKDTALAIQRLDRALLEAGAPKAGNSALVRFYLVPPAPSAVPARQLDGPAPSSAFYVEGVGSSSAGFAVDAVAPVR